MGSKLARRVVILGVIVCAAVGVSACGSSSSSSSSSASSTVASSTSGGGAAASLSVPFPPTAPTKTILTAGPLSKRPPTGKTVAYVTGTLPLYAYYTANAKAALAALGWNLKVFTFTTNQAGAMQEAIAAKPDYIWGQSLTPTAIAPEIAAAHKAGIPILNNGASDPPRPAEGYYTISRTGAFQAADIANWAIHDSKGTADMVSFNLPSFTYFVATNQGLVNQMAKCSGCSLDTVNVSLNQLTAGQVPGLIVAYLQDHPSVKYVYLAYSDMYPGVAPALKAAGLINKVKVIGIAGSQTVLRDMASKTITGAWTAYPNASVAWWDMDFFARLSVGDPVDKALVVPVSAPVWVIDNPTSAKTWSGLTYGWPGPVGYQDQYKKIWQVG